ncbi:MAG: GNAT family N-acetyltransferase [Treponema sp.]|jgi:ribosomal-protein-alanine N-acetyltransferase|nr:GNAT family N-acetyltransferase [Treponema sp.]
MHIETNRLIIRDLVNEDAQALYDIKYDAQVHLYIPDYIKPNATMEDIRSAISYCISVKDTGNFEREVFYPVILKSTGAIIGTITVSKLTFLYEIQIGWQICVEYTNNGYASEAGKAVSDEILNKFNIDYLAVVMNTDNPASFRSAIKSGFKFFEKRIGYDYFYGDIDTTNFQALSKYMEAKQNGIESPYFYFRKFNPKSKITAQFYGDVKYEGRFA